MRICMHMMQYNNDLKVHLYLSFITITLAMAEDIVRMLDDHGIASCIPVGHSMGGKAAMTLCLGHADRVAKAVIVDIAPSAYSPHRDSFQVGAYLVLYGFIYQILRLYNQMPCAELNSVNIQDI